MTTQDYETLPESRRGMLKDEARELVPTELRSSVEGTGIYRQPRVVFGSAFTSGRDLIVFSINRINALSLRASGGLGSVISSCQLSALISPPILTLR